ATCAKFGTAAAPEPAPVSGGGSSSSPESKASYGYAPSPRSKEEIILSRLEHRARRMTTKDVYEQGGEKELVVDFHKRIQQARNSLGWSQEELGQKINERKSVISKLESCSMKPDDKVVRKLEKALNIKLMEVIE
ncbi:MAG: TIGR00270 family protein, partial [Thermoplasmata archaeon]|nr:TIGR00270 family protein [Thermoplasmata archaeon]